MCYVLLKAPLNEVHTYLFLHYTPAAVGVSQRSDPWHQSPGARGGYLLRLSVGGYV